MQFKINARVVSLALVVSSLVSTTICLAEEIPCNELPLFQGCNKTPDLIALDEKFIKESLDVAGTKEQAATALIEKAWQTIQKEPKLATRRFNQAYLLVGDNPQIYWGLGIAQAMLGFSENSIALLKKGVELDPKNVNLLCDYGNAMTEHALYIMRGKRTPEAERQVNKLFADAEIQYAEAMKLDATQSLPHTRMSVVKFYLGDLENSERELALSKKLGGNGIDPRFEAALKRRIQEAGVKAKRSREAVD